MTDRPIIDITHPQDIAFCRIAQGATVQNTTLPSGFKTPDFPYRIDGNLLVPIKGGE